MKKTVTKTVTKTRHPPLRQVIAANVRAAREAHGWSQDELAQKARLRRCRIDSLERGEAGRNLNLDNLGRLADALGIEPVDLCRRNRRP